MLNQEELSKYYSGKNVLVTGGAGFIGSHLVEMLVDLQAKLTVPVRRTTNPAFLNSVKNQIDIREADLFSRSDADSVMRDQDVVIHLAAAKGGGIVHSMNHHGSLFRDNMISGINVLDAARDARIQRLCLVSSACVYPRDSKIPTPEEEGVRDAPEPTNAGYGWSKRMLEFLSLSYVEEYGMNIGIARPFNAYGPRDDFFNETNHVIPGLITRVMSGESPLKVWGSGKQTRTFLYVTDFARGVLLTCAHETVRGPLNLGNDEEVTIGELARMLVEISGLNVDVVFDSSKPDGQPRRACDSIRAKAEIGFQTEISLREGLEKTLQWYKREKQIREKAL